jgi:hypothetical protein
LRLRTDRRISPSSACGRRRPFADPAAGILSALGDADQASAEPRQPPVGRSSDVRWGGRVHVGNSSSFCETVATDSVRPRGQSRGEDGRSEGRVRLDPAHPNHPSVLTDMLEGVSADL